MIGKRDISYLWLNTSACILAQLRAARQHFVFDELLWGAVFILLGAWSAHQRPLHVSVWLLLALLLLRIILRRSNAWLVWLLGLALTFCLGVAAVEWRQSLTSTPLITEPLRNTTICGVLAAVHDNPRGKRWIVRNLQGDDLPNPAPNGVRLVANVAGYAGEALCMRADILPLPPPILPQGYDFAQVMTYQNIGGVGRVRAIISRSDTSDYKVERFLQHQRQTLIEHLKRQVPNPAVHSILIALITGETADIPQTTLEQWRAAGIVHILSVSGLHMAVVVGGTFMVLRWLWLLLWPRMAVAGRGLALLSGSAVLLAVAYLLLVGMSAPAVRSLIMSGATLAAYVVGGRLPATRTIFLAAALIVLITPESILDISFQLSFTAVLAVLLGTIVVPPPTRALPMWHYTLRLLSDLCWQSLLVTLAMAPLVAFTFNRISFYGIVANMLAVPITSIVIMPALGLALILWPLHGQGIFIDIAAFGIGLLNTLAANVAQWPYAVLMVLRPHGGLIACTTIVLTLLLVHHRAAKALFVPALLLCMGCLWLPSESIRAIVAPQGTAVLERTPAGQVTLCLSRRNDYLRERWLSRAAATPQNTVVQQQGACSLPSFMEEAPAQTQIWLWP